MNLKENTERVFQQIKMQVSSQEEKPILFRLLLLQKYVDYRQRRL